MVKKITLIVLVILNVVLLSAQSGKIRGTVLTSDGRPAEFVQVIIKDLGKGGTVDGQGQYTIENVAPGTYVLMTHFVGLEEKQKTIVLSAGETVSADFTLNENNIILSDVVISALSNRYNQAMPSASLRLNTPLLEIPQNIQVVTGQTLKDQQLISMSDGVVRNISGAIRMEHWGDLYTNISTRGSQMQAFRNGFNVVSSYWGPLTEDMSFTDHIEFVKGPAGFMLANGDPSGLYNVVTKKPTGKNKGEISFTLGSFDLYRTALDVDGLVSKDGRLQYRLNVAAQNKKSHRENEFNNRYVIAPVLSYQLDLKTRLTFEYNYQKAVMSDVGSYYVFSTEGFASLPQNFTSLPAGMPETVINDHSFFVNLEHRLNDNWRLTAQAARFNYLQEGSSMWPSGVDSSGTMIRAVSSWDAKSSMMMWQAFINGEFSTGKILHRILGGLDMANKVYYADWGQYHVLDSVGSFNSFDPDLGVPVYGYPQFNYDSPVEERALAGGGVIDQRYSSVYIQDELRLFENRVRFTIAGRYTTVTQSEYGSDQRQADHISPRTGVSVFINKSTAVYGLYDQAFIPQSGRLASGGEVKPITGHNIEGGIKNGWSEGRWSTTLSIYRIIKNNELTADPYSPPASGLSVVLGQKTSQGVEFDIRGRIMKGLNLIANYAYTDSRVTRVTDGIENIEAGDIIPGFSKHTMNTWLSFEVREGALKGAGLTAGISLLAGRQTYWDPSPDAGEVLPDYIKVDAGLFWEKEKLRINFNVLNVLDEYLYSGSYYQWLNAYYWQSEPGRNCRLNIAYKF